MFGNPKWFRRRKYLGWGLTPATWQGWLYALAIPIIITLVCWVMRVLGLGESWQIGVIAALIALIVIDGLHMMIMLDKDERETLHEALAERNVAWFLLIMISLGLVYQLLRSAMEQSFLIDPFLLIALGGATLVKSLSNWYLSDR